MNARLLTDERIRSAIDRRAMGANEGDLRERVLAATAAVPQRRDWWARLFDDAGPQRRTALTLSVAFVLLTMVAFITVLVGSQVNRTTPAPLGGLAYLAGGDLYVAGPGGESPRLVWDIPASEDLASRQLVWLDPETVLLQDYSSLGGVHVVDVATGAHRQLDTGQLVAVSPDRLLAAIAAFDESATPPDRVKVIEIATGALVREIPGLISGYPPKWSPDGRTIVAESPETVYRVDIASGERTILADGLCCGLSAHWPTWSPDGTRVVYVDYHLPQRGSPPVDCDFRCGTLWAVAAAGGEPIRLTPELGSEILPAVSPDGRWIAYVDASTGGLIVIAADGSGLPVIGLDGSVGNAFPEIRWDLDSAGITYLSPAATLWHVRLDGLVATQIEAPAISEFARQVLP